MNAKRVIYSIQQTYIIKPVSKSEKSILTCDERIDIPTIEPLTSVQPVLYEGQPLTVVPCIELAGEFLSEFNLTFETNEGVTVLPVMLNPSFERPFENPYMHIRYALVLPRGATGVKSCKVIHKATGKEVQHNFTFGIMPPPYNYDSILFGYSIYQMATLTLAYTELVEKVNNLIVSEKSVSFAPAKLPKGAGKQTIRTEDGALFYKTEFSYSLSTEVTHTPKITLKGGPHDLVYTLSLNKTTNTVLIDLLTGTITAYDSVTGEIIQQFKLDVPKIGFNALIFENFDDIDTSVLEVTASGRSLEVYSYQ